MKKFWEVRMRNSKGATELATFADEDSATNKLNSAMTEYVMVSLLEIEKADNGTETQVHAWVYHNGELYNEITEPYRRTTMETEAASNTVAGVIPENTAGVEADRAAKKAAKEAEKAAAKEARDKARAEKNAEKEAAKEAKAKARAEAEARGEKVGGVRTSKWNDSDVITWGEKYANANPKRAGSLAFESFSHYRAGMTVKEYRESGAPNPLGNINWDVDHGFIVVTKPEATPTEATEATEAGTEEADAGQL